MQELGLDLCKEFPKPYDRCRRRRRRRRDDGLRRRLPVLPGKRYLDWDLPDPAGKTTPEQVRLIRDDIDRRVRQLLDELVGTAA